MGDGDAALVLAVTAIILAARLLALRTTLIWWPGNSCKPSQIRFRIIFTTTNLTAQIRIAHNLLRLSLSYKLKRCRKATFALTCKFSC